MTLTRRHGSPGTPACASSRRRESADPGANTFAGFPPGNLPTSRRPPVCHALPRRVVDQAGSWAAMFGARSRGALRGHAKQPAPHHHRGASGSAPRLPVAPPPATRTKRQPQIHRPPTTHRHTGDVPRRAPGRRSSGRVGDPGLDRSACATASTERCNVSAIELAATRRRAPVEMRVAVPNVGVRSGRKEAPAGCRGGSPTGAPVGEPVNVCALDLPFRSDLGSRRARAFSGVGYPSVGARRAWAVGQGSDRATRGRAVRDSVRGCCAAPYA